MCVLTSRRFAVSRVFTVMSMSGLSNLQRLLPSSVCGGAAAHRAGGLWSEPQSGRGLLRTAVLLGGCGGRTAGQSRSEELQTQASSDRLQNVDDSFRPHRVSRSHAVGCPFRCLSPSSRCPVDSPTLWPSRKVWPAAFKLRVWCNSRVVQCL